MRFSLLLLALAIMFPTILSTSMDELITTHTKTTTTTTTPNPSFLTWSEVVTLVTRSGVVSTSIVSTDCGGPTNCHQFGAGVTTLTSDMGTSPTAGPLTKSPSVNPRPPAKTSTASPTQSTTASDPLTGTKSSISKSGATTIVIGVLTPLIVVAVCLLVYFIRKSRNIRRGGPHPKQTRLVSWHPRTTIRRSRNTPSPQALPMVDIAPSIQAYEPAPPPVPPKSPHRPLGRSAPPLRPPRPTSLTQSIVETLASPPQGSYLHDAMSDRDIAPYDSSSQRGFGYRYSSNPAGKSPELQQLPDEPSINTTFKFPAGPQIHDNSRDLFLRTARERGLDHTQLARESLQLSGDALDRHITPPPLVINKKGSNRSDPGATHHFGPMRVPSANSDRSRQFPPRAGGHRRNRAIPRTEHGLRGIAERHDDALGYAATEPPAGPSRYRQELPHQNEHPHARSDAGGGASLMNDGSDEGIDETELRRHRAETLATLNGERDKKRRARAVSSVYSNDVVWEPPEMPEEVMERENNKERGNRGEGSWRNDGQGRRDENRADAKRIDWSTLSGNWV